MRKPSVAVALVVLAIGVIVGVVGPATVMTTVEGVGSLLFVVASTFLVFALPGLLLWAGVLLLFVGLGVAAGVLSLVSLRWLPVVRSCLTRAPAGPGDESTVALERRSFRALHLGGAMAFGVAYVALFVVWAFVTDSLAYSGFLGLSGGDGRVLLGAYPLVVLAVLLPCVLSLNYLYNQWAPSESVVRPALEWAAFLILLIVLVSLPGVAVVVT